MRVNRPQWAASPSPDTPCRPMLEAWLTNDSRTPRVFIARGPFCGRALRGASRLRASSRYPDRARAAPCSSRHAVPRIWLLLTATESARSKIPQHFCFIARRGFERDFASDTIWPRGRTVAQPSKVGYTRHRSPFLCACPRVADAFRFIDREWTYVG
jgi:hypothetical protein